MKSIALRVVVLNLLVLFLGTGCESPSTNQASAIVQQPTLNAASAAQDVTTGVGIVQKTSSAGSKGPIFVFEEIHTSRVGRLQIAAMLVRLHDRYGLRNIGLEGSVWTGKPLESAWYQGADAGQARKEKEDLAVRMVAEGEINSSELMAMLFPDTKVYGVEDASQYQQALNVKGSPAIEYLIAISEKSLSPDNLQRVERLLKQKKQTQAFEYMLTADPWVKEQYHAFKNSSSVSAEQLVERLRAIQAKASELGVQLPTDAQQDMQNEMQFFETASQRSSTMVDNTLRLPGPASGPVAMIVGAAHADKVVELLGQQQVSFALIKPTDLDSKRGSMSVAEYERKDKGQWARNDPGTLGHILNSHHNPPPVIERVTGHSYASMNLAGLLVARAVRSGGRFPDDVWPQISSLPDLRIDRNSITRDGNDVILRGWLKQDNGSEKEVWARIGTDRHQSGNGRELTLEQKLVKESKELKEGGGGGGDEGKGGKHRNGGDEEPPDSRGNHESKLPGDSRRKGATISRIGLDTLVVYGSKREDVMRCGRISI
jgi:hypothetical protein